MAVNRRPSKERLNLGPGLLGRRILAGTITLNFSRKILRGSLSAKRAGATEREPFRWLFYELGGASNLVKFRKPRCGRKGNPGIDSRSATEIHVP